MFSEDEFQKFLFFVKKFNRQQFKSSNILIVKKYNRLNFVILQMLYFSLFGTDFGSDTMFRVLDDNIVDQIVFARNTQTTAFQVECTSTQHQIRHGFAYSILQE